MSFEYKYREIPKCPVCGKDVSVVCELDEKVRHRAYIECMSCKHDWFKSFCKNNNRNYLIGKVLEDWFENYYTEAGV